MNHTSFIHYKKEVNKNLKCELYKDYIKKNCNKPDNMLAKNENKLCKNLAIMMNRLCYEK
jgi:hypothetical protein